MEMQSSETIYYTYEEVAKYNGKNGNRTWMVYKDIVYDFTDYLDEHPGGPELVTEYAGKDGTKAYDQAGHANSTLKMLAQFKIGELHKDDRGKYNNKSEKKITDEQTKSRSWLSILTCGICG